LQRAYEVKKKQETNNDAKTGGETQDTAANWVSIVGASNSSGTQTQTVTEASKALSVTTKDSVTKNFKVISNNVSGSIGSKGGS
jgi:hypothetical protein